MPTGYTAKLMEEGQTFPEFAMTCARAFGATIMMRDEPSDAQIPEEFPVSDYHLKAGQKAREEFARLSAMTNEERIAFGTQAREEAENYRVNCQARNRAENARLRDMADKVRSWTPPTPEHTELQKFMLQQIEVSMNDYEPERSTKSPMEYYAEALTRAERDIHYHAEGYAKEIERTRERNEWIKALRASL